VSLRMSFSLVNMTPLIFDWIRFGSVQHPQWCLL